MWRWYTWWSFRTNKPFYLHHDLASTLSWVVANGKIADRHKKCADLAWPRRPRHASESHDYIFCVVRTCKISVSTTAGPGSIVTRFRTGRYWRHHGTGVTRKLKHVPSFRRGNISSVRKNTETSWRHRTRVENYVQNARPSWVVFSRFFGFFGPIRFFEQYSVFLRFFVIFS